VTDPLIEPRRRRPNGRWIRVSHGAYRRRPEPGTEPPEERWFADLATLQGATSARSAFTGLTAARAWGLALPPLPDRLPAFVTLPPGGAHPRRSGIVACRASAPPRPRLVRGVRVEPVADALLACARELGVLDVVVLLDSALHLGRCSLAELQAVAAGRRRGGPRLREAIALADGGAESAWESVLRVFHRACEVPVETQAVLTDADGGFVARADLLITGTRVLHEYDRADHRSADRQRRDLRRDRRIVDAGYVRRGYVSADLLGRAASILRDADSALGRPHDPARLGAWYDLVRESLFSPAGTARLVARWNR